MSSSPRLGGVYLKLKKIKLKTEVDVVRETMALPPFLRQLKGKGKENLVQGR